MSFFNDIKSLFKVDPEGQYDPAGRYLAFVIKAVADKNEDFLHILLGIQKKSKLTCSTEYCLHSGERRADLAIYEEDRGEPTYLVEVKVRDNNNNDHTRGQFEHYQEWVCEGHGLKVFVISPFGLPDAQMKSIEASGKALKLVDLSIVKTIEVRSDLVTLFIEYLEEAGYIMKDIDKSRASAFTHFLISAFLPHRHGLGGEVKNSAERVADGPLVFSDIVSNFQLLIQTFPSNPKKPTIQYEFVQALKASRINKLDKSTEYIFNGVDGESDKKKFFPSRQIKAGGKLSIYAYCPIGDSIYLTIGIWIQIDNSKNNNEVALSPVTYGTYAMLSKGSDNIAYKEADLVPIDSGLPKLFSSQQEAIKEFKKMTKKLLTDIKKNKPELVSSVQARLPSGWLN